MTTNRIIEILTGILALITIPITLISTFVLGLIVNLTFGLLLIPISLIWTVLFLGPLLGLSYIYEKVSFLRIPISIIGIPIAVSGYIFSALMPSMGETESRVSKLLLCHCFPYTWHFYQLTRVSLNLRFTKGYPYLLQVIKRIPFKDKLSWNYASRLKIQYELEIEMLKKKSYVG
jgi:hypothetical protein